MENENNIHNEQVIVEEKINMGALRNPWFYVSVIAVIVIIVMGYNMLNSAPLGIESTGNAIIAETDTLYSA